MLFDGMQWYPCDVASVHSRDVSFGNGQPLAPRGVGSLVNGPQISLHAVFFQNCLNINSSSPREYAKISDSCSNMPRKVLLGILR